jgi:nitroreductase
MTGQPVSREDLLRLIEAARWAPSSFNSQPWRFVYAIRDTTHWAPFLDLLKPGNRRWAEGAGALVVIAAKTTHAPGDRPSRTYAFDAGAAWQNFCLQATAQGLVVRGMEGFDYDRAAQLVRLPEAHEVLAMAAVGWPGDVEDLPEPLRDRERPSGRFALPEIAFEGRFPPSD